MASEQEYDYNQNPEDQAGGEAGADAPSVSVSGLEGPPGVSATAGQPAASPSPAAAVKLPGRPAGTPTAATAATSSVASSAGQPQPVDSKTPSAPATNGAAAGVGVSKICVKFLPVSYGEKELTDLLAQFGGVGNAKIIREHPSGTSKGYGFAEFATVAEANAAIAALNGLALENKTLRVELANSAGAAPAGGAAPAPAAAPAHSQQYAPVQGFAGYQPAPAPQLNLLAAPQPQQYGGGGAYQQPPQQRTAAPAPGTGDHTNLYVAGLPVTFQKPDLEALFSGFGTVQHVHMLVDKATGQGRG